MRVVGVREEVVDMGVEMSEGRGTEHGVYVGGYGGQEEERRHEEYRGGRGYGGEVQSYGGQQQQYGHQDQDDG
jgi:hypothetical protein